MPYLTYSSDQKKQCKQCLESLPLSDFTPMPECKMGVLPRCRSCMRVIAAKYRKENPEVHRSANRKWRSANLERCRELVRENYRQNKAAVLAKNAVWHRANPGRSKEYSLAYFLRNPEKRRASFREHYHKIKNRPEKVLRFRVTSRLNAFLAGRRKGVMREIGCSVDVLKKHIELLFPEGMSWDNRSEWEIDHYYPLSAIGENPDWISVLAVCNYRNLRPCWKFANRSKRAAIVPGAVDLFGAIKELILAGKA